MLIGGPVLRQINENYSFFRFFNLFFTLYFLAVGVVFIYTPEALAVDSSNSFTQTDWYLERPYASKSQLDAKTISGALTLDKETTTTFYGSGTLISSPQDLGGVSDFSSLNLSFGFSDDFNDNTSSGWAAVSGSWNAEQNLYRSLQPGVSKINIEVADFTYKVKISPESGNEYGLGARYQDNNNYYVLKIKGSSLLLSKIEGGSETVLAAQTISWFYNNNYWLKFEAQSGALQGKFWEDGDSEPDNWTISANDSTFSSGEIILVNNSGIVCFDDLSLTIDSFSSTNIKVQLRSSKINNLEGAVWYGPTGAADYYTLTSTSINSVHNGDKWIQYKVILETTDTSITPILDEIIVVYAYRNSDDAGKQYEGSSNTTTQDLESLSLKPVNLILDSGSTFEPPSVTWWQDFWTVENHLDNLSIRVDDSDSYSGTGSIKITGNSISLSDTGFNLQSSLIDVVPETGYTLSYWSKHNANLSSIDGEASGFFTEVRWLDGFQNSISDVDFDFGIADTSWHQEIITVTAPVDGVYAQIWFGFEDPDLRNTTYLKLDDIEFKSDGSNLIPDYGSGLGSGFEPASWEDFWMVNNYDKSKLSIGTETTDLRAGTRCLNIARPLGGGWADTAFNLQSSLIDVVPETGYILSYWSKHDINLSSIVEFVDYASEIRWLDASQVLISAQDFNFSSANTSWHQDSATATSPAGAAYAQILFGLDSPDFTAEQYLKLDNIEFKKAFPYYSSGNLTSYAYDTGDLVIFDAIAWDVDVTGAGTSIKFQLKTALDNNGAPGAWTDWLGPDGTSNTYYDTSGTSINTAHNNHQWVKYKVFLETSNTANTPVLNSLTISFSGGSWINTEWAEVQDAIAPTISSYSPTFTTSIQPTITISYQDNEKGTGVDLSSVQFLVDGSDVTNSVSSLTNSSLVYTPSSPLSVALHTVVLNISDNAGNTLSDTWYFSVKETIPTEISFRADKIMLIDGEPFFPITMYGTGIYGRGVPPAEDYGVIYSELQGAGFNSTQAYDTARTRVALMYEQAAANDLMIYFFPTATGDDYTDLYDNETDAASNIYDEINESALIGWYIGDDTSATATASQLTRLHKVATDVDPYHPTIIAVEANFYKSAGTSDIFMLENYPLISDSNQISEGVTLLTDTVDALEESGNSSQSFWSLVQAFGCQEEPCDDPDNSYYGFGWRMSTFQETKSLTYLSIIYGAKGIAFYIYSYASNPEDFWASLKSFTGELETLQPVLVSSDSNNYYSVEIEGDVEDSEGYDAVHTLLKEYNGKLYLFAVNTANETVSATFQLSEDPSLIDVEFESRSISTASKSFSDSFGAFEEHIYSWTTDTTSPQIEHTAQELAFVDDLITIQATVTDETELESVTLYYRLSDDSDWTSLAMTASLNVYTSTIQAPSVPGEIEYYIQVQDAAFHTTTQPSSSPGTPYTIEIQSGLPSVLSNLSVATSSSSAISLSWNDNSDNETGFKIYRNEVLITTTSADSTSYSDAGLKASTFYSYYVKATNDRGDSSASEIVSATTESGGGAVPISFLRNGGGEVSLVVEEEITTQEQQASTVKQILALEMPVIPVLGKPVSKMTIEELQAKITEFLAVVQRLQVLLNQLTPNTFITDIPSDYRFKITLKQGQSSDNIKYLQIFLNLDPQTQLESSGAGSPGNETSYFGSLTKAAVIKFQEKYSADILFPWDLTKGTGLVGKTTIAKINEIIERENGKI